jgi:hypothetical protein|nr:hypothetical protein [Neorhizobium tomejilense]
MRLNLSYPVMARGTPKGARNERIGVWSEQIELDVREVSRFEAPVAMIVTKTLEDITDPWLAAVQRKEVISNDGRLYVQVPRLSGEPANLDLITKRLSELLITTVMAQVGSTTKSADYWPVPGKEIALCAKSGIREFAASEEDFVVADDDMPTAELYRERARQVADGLLLVDGELWEECDEPVYTVATKASPGIEVSGAQPITASTSTHFRFAGYVEPYVRVFNANEYDMALAAKELAENYRKVLAFEPRDFIEVILPEAVTYPAAERELDRLARYLVADFSRIVKRNTAQQGEAWFENVPTPLLSAWSEVRDIVKGYDPQKAAVPDELEDAVERLLDQSNRYGRKFRDWVSDDDVAQLLSRWQDRDIDINPVMQRSFAR